MKESKHPQSSNLTRATLRVTGGACLISFSAVFVPLTGTDPTVSAFYRMLIGGVILTILTRLKGERFFQGRRPLLMLAVGGFALALDLALWHRCILFVGPGLATLLANFQVFFVAAVGVLVFRERLTWKIAVAIPLAVGGLYLIVGLRWGAFSGDYKLGVALGLAAAFCYTVYILFLRMAQQTGSTFSTITLATLFTGLFLGVFSAGHGESFAVPGLRNWLVLGAYAVVSQVLGWLLITSGIGRMEASRVGLVLLLQPTLAFVWDMLFFSRPTTLVEVAGALLAMCAIYLGTVGRAAPARAR
ncbi:MAG: DMT family transporter [Deltaproteobacteria bacterium]|nr:DMT family transporter [Deltaproteobacteria bacterium]